jgi:hypothetical protein
LKWGKRKKKKKKKKKNTYIVINEFLKFELEFAKHKKNPSWKNRIE